MAENIIEVKNLTKKFKDFAAVNNISLMSARVKSSAFWVRTVPANQQLSGC